MRERAIERGNNISREVFISEEGSMPKSSPRTEEEEDSSPERSVEEGSATSFVKVASARVVKALPLWEPAAAEAEAAAGVEATAAAAVVAAGAEAAAAVGAAVAAEEAAGAKAAGPCK